MGVVKLAAPSTKQSGYDLKISRSTISSQVTVLCSLARHFTFTESLPARSKMAIDELSEKTDKNAMGITNNGKTSIKVE